MMPSVDSEYPLDCRGEMKLWAYNPSHSLLLLRSGDTNPWVTGETRSFDVVFSQVREFRLTGVWWPELRISRAEVVPEELADVRLSRIHSLFVLDDGEREGWIVASRAHWGRVRVSGFDQLPLLDKQSWDEHPDIIDFGVMPTPY